MKHIRIPIFSILGLLLILTACKKNVLTVAPYDYANGKALLKINYSCPYLLNPGVMIKINGEKVSSLVTYSTPYPGGGLNTGGNSYADYLSVKPGQNTVSLSIPFVGTNKDSVLLYQNDFNLQADTYQSIHFTDTSANTQGVLLTDASAKPDSGYTQFRFVNLIPNSTGIDLYFGPTKVASNIAYKQATDTFLLPTGNSLIWSLRLAGGTTTLGTTYQNTGTVANQRVFTVYSRGYIGLPTADIRSPKISFAYNK